MSRQIFIVAATSAVWLLIVPTTPAQTPFWKSKTRVAALAKQIDDYFAAVHAEAGVSPVGAADPGTFFRRLHIDLAGLIPEYTVSRGYVEDGDPEKLWGWTERFLSDHTFGSTLGSQSRKLEKTFGRHFAAVLRAHWLQSVNQQASPYVPQLELWLRRRLDKEMGYDQLVRDLLAPGRESYDIGSPRSPRAAQSEGSAIAFYLAAESKAENLAAAVSRVFLGVKLECAQCHAHPFAKWTKEEFWQFAAFFTGTGATFGRMDIDDTVRQNAPVLAQRDILIPGTNKRVRARFLTGEEPQWRDDVATRTVLAEWITDRKNPYFAKATVDFLWQYFFGVSLLEPILEPSDDSPITHPKLLDLLAEQFSASNFDLKFLIRAIVHTQAYQRSSGNEGQVTRDDYVLHTRMPVRGLSPEQLYDSIIEAVLGPKGHEETMYPIVNNMQRPVPGSRAEFLSKFANHDKRHETQTSILQALYLMNNKFLADRIRDNENLARLASAAYTPRERVRTMFLLVLSREPRPEEYDRLLAFLHAEGADLRQRLGDLLWALVNTAEFRLNH
ncbi:MAG: DUF1549 and DUF1553 domain-containing protein [Gemmataceae bacterium]|nr:DUF1549 and DUF1553 domain-containing protein [Gemmataceae bacterium]